MSAKKTRPKNENFDKSEPTLFPFGFGLQRVEDDIIVIDFFDMADENENQRIISSIAMPTSRARLLANSILGIKDETE
ncbi:hypothetical protein D3C80_425990 [compost metagenome]|jgi:hypothetical protein